MEQESKDKIESLQLQCNTAETTPDPFVKTNIRHHANGLPKNSDQIIARDLITSVSSKIGYINILLKNIMTFLRHLVTISVVVVIATLFYLEWQRNNIIIEPYEVSSSLEKGRYNGKMFANMVMDEANKISRSAKTTLSIQQFIQSWTITKYEINLPSSELSITSLITYLKVIFGRKETHITGEAFETSDGIVLITRVDRMPPFRQIIVSGNNSTPIKNIAEYIYLYTQPYVLATYYYAADRVKCYKTIDYILTHGSDKDKSLAFSLLGILLTDENNYSEAILNFQKAIDLNPKGPIAYLNLGVVLERQGNLKEALAKYQKAITLDHKFAPTYAFTGSILGRQGNLKGAISLFQKAIGLDPKYAPTYYFLGFYLAEKGDLKGATAQYQKAIDLNPNYAEAYKHLGDVLEKQGNLKGAITSYQKAIKIEPKYARAYNKLGEILEMQGDLKGAMANYQKAIEHQPNRHRHKE